MFLQAIWKNLLVSFENPRYRDSSWSEEIITQELIKVDVIEEQREVKVVWNHREIKMWFQLYLFPTYSISCSRLFKVSSFFQREDLATPETATQSASMQGVGVGRRKRKREAFYFSLPASPQPPAPLPPPPPPPPVKPFALVCRSLAILCARASTPMNK